MGVKFTNNASSTLASSISNTGTSITVTSGQGGLFPSLGANEYFFATLVDSSNNLEIIKVTARSADSLTVVRGQNLTTARAYTAGDKIELRLVSGALQELIQRDGSVVMASPLDMGTQRVINVATPTSAADATTKTYVDAADTNEATTRANADTAEATTRANADTAEANARIAADNLKLNKAGDTMTGTLQGTTIKSDRGGEDARNTGFQFASGADIGEGNRSTQYYDDRVSNCNGYIGNGNCQGNPLWTPPNTAWWTWGAGFPSGNCGNPSGYDFAGGQSNTLDPVDYIAFNYDGYYEAANEIGGSEQRRNFRNCNCGNCIGNCFTNCNCNCACACDCNCK